MHLATPGFAQPPRTRAPVDWQEGLVFSYSLDSGPIHSSTTTIWCRALKVFGACRHRKQKNAHFVCISPDQGKGTVSFVYDDTRFKFYWLHLCLLPCLQGRGTSRKHGHIGSWFTLNSEFPVSQTSAEDLINVTHCVHEGSCTRVLRCLFANQYPLHKKKRCRRQ